MSDKAQLVIVWLSKYYHERGGWMSESYCDPACGGIYADGLAANLAQAGIAGLWTGADPTTEFWDVIRELHAAAAIRVIDRGEGYHYPGIWPTPVGLAMGGQLPLAESTVEDDYARFPICG